MRWINSLNVLMLGIFGLCCTTETSASYDDDRIEKTELWPQHLLPEMNVHVDTTLQLLDTTPPLKYSTLQGYVRLARRNPDRVSATPTLCYFSVFEEKNDTLHLVVATVPGDYLWNCSLHKRDLANLGKGDTLFPRRSQRATQFALIDSLVFPKALPSPLDYYVYYARTIQPSSLGLTADDFENWQRNVPDSLLPEEIASLPSIVDEKGNLKHDLRESEEYQERVRQAFAVAKENRITSFRLLHSLEFIGDYEKALYLHRRTRFFVCGTGWRLPGYILPDAASLAVKANLTNFVLAYNLQILNWVPTSLQPDYMSWITVQQLQDLNIDVFACMLGSCLIVDGDGTEPLGGDAIAVGSHLALLDNWQDHAQKLASLVKNPAIDDINRIVCLRVLMSLWHHVEQRHHITIDTSAELGKLMASLPQPVSKRKIKRTK